MPPILAQPVCNNQQEKKSNNELSLQDKYDIAASAAPRCIAVQHMAAFWKEISRREPDAANTS